MNLNSRWPVLRFSSMTSVPVTDHVIQYALALVRQTRVTEEGVPEFIKDWLSWGAGPRATQYLVLGAKARAVLHGRYYVSCEDIRAVATPVLRGHGTGFVRVVGFLVMKVFAIAASITIFFLIYWVLPNGKVPARAVLPVAIIMGLLSEALKYAYILALPWLNFQEVYGPFALSVTMMFWAFLSGLLLLAGAHLSAEEYLRNAL